MSSIQKLRLDPARGGGPLAHCPGAGGHFRPLTAWRARHAARFLVVLFLGALPPAEGLHANAATFGGARRSRAARKDAIGAIPFDQLTPEAQQRIGAVVSKPSVYRRLPIEVVDCDPTLYLFLVRNPEVVVNIWDLMGITQIDLKRTGPYTFEAADGMGTTSSAELVYGTDDIHLVYGEGVYDGPLLPKPVQGRCVLLLRSGYVPTQGGRVHVTSCLDVFLQLDNVAVDVVARTIHPLLGRTADMNFVQTVAFLGRISRNAERNGPGMKRLAQRLAKVDPAVRLRFAELAASVGANSSTGRVSRQPVIQASRQQLPLPAR
jgi:hypothetical protein